MTHKKTIAIIIVIVNMLLSSFTYSQIVENSCGTVNIEAPAYLVLNDTSIHVFNDSTAIICTKYLILTKKNGYSLYTKLLDKSKKHALVKKVFQLLIASGTQDTMLVKKALMEAEDASISVSLHSCVPAPAPVSPISIHPLTIVSQQWRPPRGQLQRNDGFERVGPFFSVRYFRCGSHA